MGWAERLPIKAPPLRTVEQFTHASLFDEQWNYFNEALKITADLMREGSLTIARQRADITAQQVEIAQQKVEIDRLKRQAKDPDPVVVLVMLLVLGCGWPFAAILYYGVFGLDAGSAILTLFTVIWGSLVGVAVTQVVLAKKGKLPW